jgi:hypothetical protein
MQEDHGPMTVLSKKWDPLQNITNRLKAKFPIIYLILYYIIINILLSLFQSHNHSNAANNELFMEQIV